ncbi:MAG: hypothetical protein B7X57_10205 [Erythrobacter sp. 34-65-8]|nr:MAG: hypothetical protein B7X57_10205 [Erythrobacter sp. 34-65-8]
MESALSFLADRPRRLLVLPALFDEANKLRRQTAEVMHRLDLSGIDSVLPDLPGCNESLQPLEQQTLEHWCESAITAMEHFRPTHVLAIRGGALLDTGNLPGWRFAPVNGRSVLRSMLRARTIAAKEAGREETLEALQATARREGIELAGWRMGAEFFRELEQASPPEVTRLTDLGLADTGGSGLWLRAEPDHDRAQADALAAIIAIGMRPA